MIRLSDDELATVARECNERLAAHSPTCPRCGIEVDRFGDGPWFHVDTMLVWCGLDLSVRPTP